MSTVELVTCAHEGCEWSAAIADPDDARYQLRAHETEAHERERPAETAPPSSPTMAVTSNAGRTIGELELEERAADLARVITVRCADCVAFEETGPQAEVRMRWAEHRRDDHGDAQAVERTRQAIEGEGRRRRRAGAPVLSGGRDIDANLEKARRAGAGHGRARAQRQEEKMAAHQETWTRELAIERLRGFHAEHGRMPKQHELRAPLPGQSTLVRLFGSQTNGIQAAEKAIEADGPAQQTTPEISDDERRTRSRAAGPREAPPGRGTLAGARCRCV